MADFLSWMLIVSVLVIFSLGGYYFWMMSKFKHIFIVRKLTGSKTFIIIDKARHWKSESGVEYWRLLKLKSIIPLPPKDAINVTSKGVFVVEAYMTEEGEFQYLFDTKQNFMDPQGNPNYYRTFQPFTTNQRLILINQIRKAESKRKKGLLEMIPMLASGLMVIIVFFGALVFWEDITKPAAEASASLAATAEKFDSAATKLDNIINQRQTIYVNPQGQQQPQGVQP